MMAISYRAEGPAGEKVFLKQYKSPSPTVVWYKDYIGYQKEMARRMRGGAAPFAVQQIDAFEEVWGGPCYFQAFEFVENGADLQQILDEEREAHRRTKVPPTSDPVVWARHVTWAKVFMTAVSALHEAKVVHADLKPANAYLMQDSTLRSGYQLKLIDMDFSLLADRRAPWHGHQGYIGTDNYRSPEHMSRGAVPGQASDVFTCGLMLYELLAGYHPYWVEDAGSYAKLVQGYAVTPPTLKGQIPMATDTEVSSILHQCLSPDPARRPTAAQIRAVLSGRAPPTISARDPTSAASADPLAVAELIRSKQIELTGPEGRFLRIGVRTALGKSLISQFGPESEFWDQQQCILERGPGEQWSVSPVPGTTNETLVNGNLLTAAMPLRQGDTIAAGRAAKRIIKMPLTARSVR
jgi:serine/threonine protein kinase